MDDNLTFRTMQTIQRKRIMVVRYNMAQSLNPILKNKKNQEENQIDDGKFTLYRS